jgi:two-component system, LytTR family, response regulator
MNSTGRAPSVTTNSDILRGIRVVSLDTDIEVHASLRSIIEEYDGFVLVGATQDWTECKRLLDTFVPELLIADTDLIPPQLLNALTHDVFPLLVDLQGTGQWPTGAEPYKALSQPLDQQSVHNLLNQVQSEVCRRKADELSALIERYVAFVAQCEQYLTKLKVEEGQRTEVIEMDRILSFSADGNYVRVHTGDRAFEVRDTMTGIFAKLDPSRFARVHRSFIVNLSQIQNVVTREGSTTSVILSNGMEVPVGPNYRDNFSSVTQLRNRLIA